MTAEGAHRGRGTLVSRMDSRLRRPPDRDRPAEYGPEGDERVRDPVVGAPGDAGGGGVEVGAEGGGLRGSGAGGTLSGGGSGTGGGGGSEGSGGGGNCGGGGSGGGGSGGSGGGGSGGGGNCGGGGSGGGGSGGNGGGGGNWGGGEQLRRRVLSAARHAERRETGHRRGRCGEERTHPWFENARVALSDTANAAVKRRIGRPGRPAANCVASASTA